MSLDSKRSSSDGRTRIAHALGFSDYPTNKTPAPYLNYILKQYAGSETAGDYLELFIEVLEHFRTSASPNGTPTTQTVNTLFDKFVSSGFRNVFTDTDAGDSKRKEHVEDKVMCIIGTWTTMLSSFQLKNRSRKVVAAHRIFAGTTVHATIPTTMHTSPPSPPSVIIEPYDESVAGLITGSGLLPGGQWDHRISLESDATAKLMGLMLNASNFQGRNALQNMFASTSGRTTPPKNRTSLTSYLTNRTN